MPRKSRKQKMRAAIRKAHIHVSPAYSFTAQLQTKNVLSSELRSHVSLIVADLRKTLVLGIVFLAALLILYFYSNQLGW